MSQYTYKPKLISADLSETDAALAKGPIVGRAARQSFVLQDPSLSDADLTRAFLKELAQVQNLREVRMDLGVYLAGYLRSMVRMGYGKVLTSESFVAGRIFEALSHAEDAMQFMTGSISTVCPWKLELLHGTAELHSHRGSSAEKIDRIVREHINRRGLRAEIVLSITSEHSEWQPGWVRVVISKGKNKEEREYFLNDAAHDLSAASNQERLAELGAICALHQLGLWIAREIHHPNIRLRLNSVENLKDLNPIEDPKLAMLIVRTEHINYRTWQHLSDQLRAIGHIGLFLAESFTRGLLAELVGSGAGRSLTEYSYIFYDPELKADLGVSPQNLLPERIAAVDTAHEAADSLAHLSSKEGRTTIATTGYSNRLLDGDCFSVAVHDTFKGKSKHFALSAQVTATQDWPKSNGRKLFLSHLGCTGALLCLTRALLARRAPALNQELLRKQAILLDNYLRRFAVLS